MTTNSPAFGALAAVASASRVVTARIDGAAGTVDTGASAEPFGVITRNVPYDAASNGIWTFNCPGEAYSSGMSWPASCTRTPPSSWGSGSADAGRGAAAKLAPNTLT